MTEQEKQLLFKDLCARLPYYNGFTVEWKGDTYNIIGVGFGRVTLIKPFMSVAAGSPLVEEVRPYLRPMASMTEEEKEEYTLYCFEQPFLQKDKTPNLGSVSMCIDWLNARHFDYRGLIGKGLALEAPEGMYNI